MYSMKNTTPLLVWVCIQLCIELYLYCIIGHSHNNYSTVHTVTYTYVHTYVHKCVIFRTVRVYQLSSVPTQLHCFTVHPIDSCSQFPILQI